MDRNSPVALALQALNETMRRDVRRHLFWSKFQGSIDAGPDPHANGANWKPSGSVIEVNNGIRTHGIGDRMLIPMRQGLTGPATYGDATLIGNEEDSARKWAYVHYNQIRHAATLQKGAMDTIREDKLKAAQYVQPELSIWHAEMENWAVTQAFMEGISEGLSTSATDATYGEGLGLVKRYSPNLFSWTGATDATGAYTRIGTAGKFPTAQQVRDGVKNVNTSDHDTDLNNNLPFTPYTAHKARTLVAYRKLKPLFRHGGKNFWGWLISPAQAETLLLHELFRAYANSQQWANIADHPLVQGAVGAYGSFVFFESETSVRGFAGAETNGSDLNILGTATHYFSDEDKYNPRFNPIEGAIAETGGYLNHVSHIFGASALGKADHSAHEFKFENVDYDNWKGVAAAAVYGYERLDFVKESQISSLEATPSNCTGVYNESSIQVITWQQI